MPGDLLIRDFEPRDLAAVLALNVQAFDAAADPRESARIRPELLNIPEAFQQDGAFLVGTIDGAIVAMGSIKPESGMSYRVNFVRVAVAHQRRGYAGQIMAALEARATDLGATAIVLDTTVEQVPAQHLYESIGYSETHRSTVSYESMGTFDIVNYRKPLTGKPAAAPVEMSEWQWALLHECRVARLATIGPGGRPHLVPVVFAVVDEGIAIAIDEKPKRSTSLARLRHIERDPRVSFLADHYDDDWSQLAWVRVDGTATVLERGDAHPEALAALRRRYPQHRDMALEDLPLILIEPERVIGWRAE
jgi:PPOX class probable F420-dependent enzyme